MKVKLKSLKIKLNAHGMLKKMVSSSHTVKTIENGTCKNLNIKYTYLSNPNTYGIRWEK
jgi:hypothetical protein